MKRATSFYSSFGLTAYISIHALVKRATFAKALSDKGINISIHALVKRATKTFPGIANAFAISIHALVKRATTKTYTAGVR